ncbi:hypothetical protein M0811_12429 [Anaeramoeba ignava]|uniref:Uncharacterized protein n=1 Tax=Anaeramoeba ignava TaxID=1746090 RepID=A0A9Q0L8J4_ANAIG|nr:hypothetical protein M0811_12429 [Anaeramoeba ignava]
MIFPNPLILQQAPVFVQQESETVRNRFIRKIYTTLTIQILTTYIIFRIILSLPLKQREELFSGSLILLTTLIAIISLGLSIFERNKYPRNLVYLALWTFFQALTLGFSLASISQPSIVKIAFKFATGIFALLTMFTFQNRFSIDRYSLIFFTSSLETLWIVLYTFIYPADFYYYGRYYLFSLISIVIFSVYVILDTSRILDSVNQNDWVLAVILLYFDFIRLFMKLLRLLQRISENEKKKQRRK